MDSSIVVFDALLAELPFHIRLMLKPFVHGLSDEQKQMIAAKAQEAVEAHKAGDTVALQAMLDEYEEHVPSYMQPFLKQAIEAMK